MRVFKNPLVKKYLLISLIAVIGILLGACSGLNPQFTYQGVLTDASGNPYNGDVTITYSLYNEETGGTALYSETETVTVTDGRFDSVVGPSGTVSGLSPDDLSQALWIELTIGNGTITETLQPRQRLYGAPYAFTLMPGAVISDTFNTGILGTDRVQAILTVRNSDNDSNGDPAHPALRVLGTHGIQVDGLSTGLDGSDFAGTIYGSTEDVHSDLDIYSRDNVDIMLDLDNNSGDGRFSIYDYTGTRVFSVNENGDYVASGTKSAVVQAQGEERLVYTIESPEVWFEDFGSGQLVNGKTTVQVDPLFADTVNLQVEYHVFLTPLGDCNGLYVTNKTATGFEVRELNGGTSSVAFDYRIVAKRVGYEGARMEVVPASPDGE